MKTDLSKIIPEYDRSLRDLRYIGDSEAGLNWFCDNYSGLEAVLNTVYRPRDKSFHPLKDSYKRYETAIKRCITDGCVWTDYLMKGQEGMVKEFYDALSDDEKQRYSAHQFKEDIPIPLFQISLFRYRDRSKDTVSFGWRFRNVDRPMVYVSRNRDTFDYFSHYFREMMPFTERVVWMPARRDPVTAVPDLSPPAPR